MPPYKGPAHDGRPHERPSACGVPAERGPKSRGPGGRPAGRLPGVTDTDKAADAPDSSAGRAAVPLPQGAELARLRRRTAAVLVVSQMLGGLGVTTAITLAAVLAKEISGSEALSGLASTSTVIGTALLSLPLASLMAARGRRVGLWLAYLIGAAGGAVVVA